MRLSYDFFPEQKPRLVRKEIELYWDKVRRMSDFLKIETRTIFLKKHQETNPPGCGFS
jgi:hypothetical protein